MKTTLLSIFRGHWAISPDWVAANMPMIDQLMKADFDGNLLNKRNESIEIFADGKFASTPVYNVGFYSDISKLPKGSIAIVDVVGPIIKYGGMCSYGSLDYADLTARLDASDNVSAIIFNVDSPGGQVNGTSTFADAIKACSKLTICLIQDGYAASAGYWIASACDYIYCSHAIDQVGSIGVYCTLADMEGYYEKQGLKIYNVYAPQSTRKNADVKDVFAGKPEALQAELKVIAAAFIDTVKENRGDRIQGQDWQSGGMYYAPAAQTIGLIDGIKSMAEIIGMIESGELSKPQNSTTKNSEATMFGNKLSKTYGLRGKKADEITAEDLQAANAELHANGIDPQLTLARQAAAGPSAEELTSANDALDAATAELDNTKASLNTANLKIAELEKTIAEAGGKQPGASFVQPKGKAADADAIDEDADTDTALLATFEHNKNADALFSWKV